MAFIENIPEEAFEPTGGAVTRTKEVTPSTSKVSQSIRKEEIDELLSKKKQLNEWLLGRADIRKKIVNGEISSGNKGRDNAEVRKTRLADLARGALEEMGKSPDAIKKTTDDDLIKRLVGSTKGTDMKKLNAVNTYMQNGGYAEDVFNYLVGNTSDIYESVGEPKEERSKLKNFLGAAVSTPAESLAGIADITQKKVKYGGKSIYDINKEADIAGLGDLIGGVSEEEYQKYKEEGSKWYEKAFNVGKEGYYNIGDIEIPGAEGIGSQYISRANFYNSYDKAKEAGFDGGVEQYGQYIYNMANNTYNSAAEKVRNYLETEVYDPEGKGAGLGKFAGEMLEFALLPELKVKYLKYAPEATKATKTATKTINAVKGLTKLGTEGVKLQALEDAYDAELSSLGKYATTAAWNAAIGGVIKGIGNALGAPKGLAKEAIGTKTQSEWNKMTNITERSFSEANAEVTPYTEVRDILLKAKKRLLGDRLEAGGELGETRAFDVKYQPGVRYTAKEALEQDINKSLMEQASKKRFGNLAGKKDLVPQFKITKNGLEVSNADVLNNISKNENGAVVKLWDKIKMAYSETFGAGASKNAATTEKFLRRLENVFGEQGWSGGPENFINLMKEGIKNATEKFESSLTEESLSKLKTTKAADKQIIELDNAFNNIIGRLEGVEGVGAAEKASKSSVTTQELFKKVLDATKKDGKGVIDLNNEIGAWIANMSIYDVKAAQKLLENIYPSQPGAMEFVIKSILGSLKRKGAVKATKDYTPSTLGRIWENIGGVVSSQL